MGGGNERLRHEHSLRSAATRICDDGWLPCARRDNCMSKRVSSKKEYLASHVISDRVLPHFSVPLVPSWAVRRSGRGPRPRLAVGRKTSGGRAWQVKVVEVTSGQDMEDQTNRAKSEQDTSNNVDSLSRIAF